MLRLCGQWTARPSNFLSELAAALCVPLPLTPLGQVRRGAIGISLADMRSGLRPEDAPGADTLTIRLEDIAEGACGWVTPAALDRHQAVLNGEALDLETGFKPENV